MAGLRHTTEVATIPEEVWVALVWGDVVDHCGGRAILGALVLVAHAQGLFLEHDTTHRAPACGVVGEARVRLPSEAGWVAMGWACASGDQHRAARVGTGALRAWHIYAALNLAWFANS